MAKRRCKIYILLQNEENGNVLLSKKVKITQKTNIVYDIQCPTCLI